MIELPHLFVQTLIYGLIVYAMIGFEWTAAKFLWFIFFMYFTLLYFTLYGMMTVAVTPNHNIAAIISSAFYGFWNLFSGFIIPKTVSFRLTYQTQLSEIYKRFKWLWSLMTENTSVVEMVLLHLSCIMDIIRINCFTVWRC